MPNAAKPHRRIEIAISQSLNDAFVLREQLHWFAERIRHELVSVARSIREPNIYFLYRINFPSMREVYRDTDMARFKVKSYYIHNKLLFLDAAMKQTNETILALRGDFEDVIRQNALLVAAMRDNPNPPIQRQTYADNLEAFAKVLESFAEKSINPGLKAMVQVKVYNNLLRERYGYWVWRKHEGTFLKYFRTKAEQKAHARNLESLDTIDVFIEEKVLAAMKLAEDRAKKHRAANPID